MNILKAVRRWFGWMMPTDEDLAEGMPRTLREYNARKDALEGLTADEIVTLVASERQQKLSVNAEQIAQAKPRDIARRVRRAVDGAA